MPAVSEKVAVQTQQRVESKMPAIMEKLAGTVKAGKGGAHGATPAAKPAK